MKTLRLTFVLISLFMLGSCSNGSSSKVNMANFNKIHNGMTRAQVEAIVGPGEVMSEGGDGAYHTVMLSWKAGTSDGANMNVMLQGDQVQNKAQVGLQ